MTGSERPKASPTTTSELPRWVALILIAGVVLYSGSFAVGLMIPGRDIFRAPPKTAAYLPPPSATADTPLVEASTSAHVVAVPPPSSPPREAAPNPPKDTASQDSNKFSTASDLATLPATNPPQDADLNTQKNVASRDAAPNESGSQESDSISTTSALAREARPRNSQQGAAVNSNDANQDSSLPPATLGFAPVGTSRDRPVMTTQNSPLTEPVAAPKRQAPSEFSRKMWYK
jgi:hypothetical protein